jgi:hypothetical protein
MSGTPDRREENWKCRDNLKGDGVPTVAERGSWSGLVMHGLLFDGDCWLTQHRTMLCGTL